MQTSQMLELAKSKRREQAIERLYRLIMEKRGVTRPQPFSTTSSKTYDQYAKLYDMLQLHSVSYKDYVEVMATRWNNLFPSSLASEKALKSYFDQVNTLKKRYSNSQVVRGDDYIHLLRHDFMLVSTCSRGFYTARQFFTDVGPLMQGLKLLTVHLETYEDLIHRDSYTLLHSIRSTKCIARNQNVNLINKVVEGLPDV